MHYCKLIYFYFIFVVAAAKIHEKAIEKTSYVIMWTLNFNQSRNIPFNYWKHLVEIFKFRYSLLYYQKLDYSGKMRLASQVLITKSMRKAKIS